MSRSLFTLAALSLLTGPLPAKDTPSARPHWSFQPIAKPVPPTLRAPRSTFHSPLDAFILARLEKEGLAPSPEADRVTLVRRLHLDLVGLPPSPAAVDAALSDPSEDWYERLVDRLLASPHFGERWVRHWLDLARYADSNGYDNDEPRPNAFRWRDWVINALNRDVPYDRFVVEQLAGDLLPGSTAEQKLATGFHRNTPTNTEGGVDREEFRIRTVGDRVATTARVFLGLTLECAQCHDHKFDPLPQKDYYRFLAFFNSDVESDITLGGSAKAQTLALGTIRKTHVLARGDFQRPGAEVTPGTPMIFTRKTPGADAPGSPTRLDLARWIVSPENPLAARVAVNRLWQHLFGGGLVATPDDFGKQGQKPSHPELLDWLAGEFVRAGWSQKAMLRLLVNSATYRQSSRHRADLRERDPDNLLLARQNRFRLEAEALRDSALVASGLLYAPVGGPAIRPPILANDAKSGGWQPSPVPERHRRGLYVLVQRTVPYPMLSTFDAPDSHVACTRRDRSNTPLQALTLLNDPVFVECARALARRVLSDGPADLSGRLRFAVRLCLGREPTLAELTVLARLHERMSAFTPKDAHAAWTGVARTLLNLDEFLTRD